MLTSERRAVTRLLARARVRVSNSGDDGDADVDCERLVMKRLDVVVVAAAAAAVVVVAAAAVVVVAVARRSGGSKERTTMASAQTTLFCACFVLKTLVAASMTIVAALKIADSSARAINKARALVYSRRRCRTPPRHQTRNMRSRALVIGDWRVFWLALGESRHAAAAAAVAAAAVAVAAATARQRTSSTHATMRRLDRHLRQDSARFVAFFPAAHPTNAVRRVKSRALCELQKQARKQRE